LKREWYNFKLKKRKGVKNRKKENLVRKRSLSNEIKFNSEGGVR